jgi:hypothetical protein
MTVLRQITFEWYLSIANTSTEDQVLIFEWFYFESHQSVV